MIFQNFVYFWKLGLIFEYLQAIVLLPNDLAMSWSKKNENWSQIVGGVGLWKIAQKLENVAITQKL